MKNVFYSSRIGDFKNETPDQVLGIMARENFFDLEIQQKNAWIKEIELLQAALRDEWNEGKILFEYTIPRLGKRIDAVLLINGIVFILEFKVGATVFSADARKQTMNYAYDLHSFHKASANRILVPILVATNATPADISQVHLSEPPYIYDLIQTNGNDLDTIVRSILANNETLQDRQWQESWEFSKYLPTPTIIEAATSMYKQHNVTEIANCESQENISVTSKKIIDIIEDAEQNGKKSICFVTGVPGAGKTLVGLNIANDQHARGKQAVYLSGNKPLVDVLTEALARDKTQQIDPNTGRNFTKSDSIREVESFIQIVHHYRDVTLDKLVSPRVENRLEINPDYVRRDDNHGYAEVESVAIFDEAQRAWKREDLASFLKDNDFPLSESAFFIWSMDLREDSAVIVCLVGNGQEINHGEAGIKEWIQALVEHFPNWNIHLSSELIKNELKTEQFLLEKLEERRLTYCNVFYDEDLHLRTSIRSLRSEEISKLVEYILEHKTQDACALYNTIKEKFPIYLTRSVSKAKEWLRHKGAAENMKVWLESKGFNGTIKEWVVKNCSYQTKKNFFESKIPTSNLVQWVETNFSGEHLVNLKSAIQARGGTQRNRLINAADEDICNMFFSLHCPEIEIKKWIRKELPDDSTEKQSFLDEIPDDYRYGLVASSSAKRLKALGIEVKNEKQVSVANWFLDETSDIRSSNFLEEVVSEFVVQGLELDYVGLIWDADFRSVDGAWQQMNFTGSSWSSKNEERADYQLNAYRVLMTRARLGMVIVVPEGDYYHVDGFIDKTRLPEFYDGTYEYLKSLGLDEL